jgi:4-amino-4-deoxy-L-arabinose transferase-like glycosyltransferase
MTSENAVSSQHIKTWRGDKLFYGIVALAILFGLCYNYAIYIGYGPDEGRHMNYVKLLWDERSFPYLVPDASARSGFREYASAHSLHPPLYYFLLAPFYAIFRSLPGDGVWHVLRLISLALVVCALPLWYDIAHAAGKSRNFARLVCAQFALLPIVGMISGAINNDNAMVFAVALFLWLICVKFPDDVSTRSALILGICFGLGALCKATVLICDGAALLVLWWMQRKNLPLSSAQFWKRALAIVVPVVLIAGPWYYRNKMLYGKWTGPIEGGYSLVDINWLPSGGPLVAMMHENFPQFFGIANWSIFYSLWSQKDWIPESVRSPIYYVLAVYCALAIIGLIVSKSRRKSVQAADVSTHNETLSSRLSFWAPVWVFVLNWLACLAVALFQHWGWHEGGRYLVAALGGFSVLLATGWRSLAGERALKSLAIFWIIALVALNSLTLYWLLSYLNPTFGPKS